jgi:DNA-binding CsgD family transcriptional regulator
MLLIRVSDPFYTSWSHEPRIIAYMCMNGRETLPSPQRLRLKFGLTRREAALAILLSRGLTLGQAATDLGISEQTARAYLRQIFQKAGVSRQADLVRQVFGSIGAIA